LVSKVVGVEGVVMAVEVGKAGKADMVHGTVGRAVVDGMVEVVGMGITTHGISFPST
jgi:hypothetical protein